MLSDLIPHTVRKPARGWDCMEKAGKTPFRVPADRGRDLRFFRVQTSMCNPKQIINVSAPGASGCTARKFRFILSKLR